MFLTYYVSFICWTVFHRGIKAQDPCTESQIISDPTRSIQYALGAQEPDKCDRLITEGWYRVAENGTIPLICPDILRCGSLSPIWLNDTLPAVGEQRSMKACLRGFIKCCPIHFQIDVRNCGGFMVYRLISPPACPGRYCIDGPAAPCAEGTSSESGFEPCEKITIEFDVTVSVEPFIPTFDATSQLNKLAFRCRDNGMKQKYQSYTFDYVWYVDQEEVYTKEKLAFVSLNEGRVLYLHEWDPKGIRKLGFKIYCAVRARESTNSVPTPYTKSDIFFAGAEVTRVSSHIDSGEKAILKIKSTVPVPCRHFRGRTDCNVSIEMFSLKDQFKTQPAHCNVSVDDIKASTCGMTFDGTKWNTQHDFELQTLQDQSSRPAYTCTAKLISRTSLDTLWHNYQLPEVKIHVVGKNHPKGTCSSYNDPHIRSVDGKSFTIHEKGEFVLYHQRKKPIDIHTIHKWEGDGKSDSSRQFAYNCAIIIKASDDMFVIYGCDVPPRWIVRRLNCGSSHKFLEVYEKGTQYEIVLPTGTLVKVRISGNHWLNIYIYYSPNDWNETDGLCGTYNGNSNDDTGDKNRWKVPDSKSLFRAKSRKEKLANDVLYCSCLDKSVFNEAGSKNKADCQWQESLPMCKPLKWKETKCQMYGRTKREIDDDLEFDVPMDVVEFKESNATFDWKNGWTEEKAVNACKSYAKKSKLYQKCSTLNNIKSDSDLETCVADIKISGSDFYLVGSLDRMKSACINEVRTNTSFWVPKPVTTTTSTVRPTTPKGSKKTDDKSPLTSPATTTTETPEELEEFLDNFDTSGFLADFAEEIFEINCPNDCSGYGDCFEGVCKCNNGYGGDDCSLDTRKNLELYGVSKESLCDLSKRACSHISVFASEFYESETILCLMKEAELDGQEFKPRNKNTTSGGSLRSFSEVRCPIGELKSIMTYIDNRTDIFPILDVYLISVSLDGERFSTESPIVVHDSTCTNCRVKNGKVNCRTREDICIVNQKCYEDQHEMCKTKREKEIEENVSYAFIGYSVGGLSLIILPAILVYKRKS